MLFALPHFLTGDYEYSSGDIKDLCEDPEACVESDSKEKGGKKISEAGIELAQVLFAKKRKLSLKIAKQSRMREAKLRVKNRILRQKENWV